MGRLRRSWRTWRGLTWTERRQLAWAWLLLPLTTVGLRLFGFRRVQAALLAGALSAGRVDLPTAQGTARLVHSAAQWSPLRGSCLAQSLVLCRLLRGQGLAAELRVGMTRTEGRFEAHAWVEHGDVVLNDRQDVGQRFAAFESLNAGRVGQRP